MTLSASDLFAFMLVLGVSNLVLALAMRRVYVLEKRLAKLQGYNRVR